MSVSFCLKGVPSIIDCPICPANAPIDDCDRCYGYGSIDQSGLNVSNINACDLFAFLGMAPTGPEGMVGEIRIRDLKPILARLKGTQDRGRLGYVSANVIGGGRPPERMQDYISALETLCEKGGDLGIIVWS